jgi:hypothetical protein
MKADSWEFLLKDENKAFNITNWHSVELKLLRNREVGEMYRRHGGEEASRILKERKESIERRNKVFLSNINIDENSKEITNECTRRYSSTR